LFGHLTTRHHLSTRGPFGPTPRVGLPRALLTYRYYALWREFLVGLGCEVVEPPWTNQRLLDDGARVTVDDICIPVKVFAGHLLYLRERGVDAILVPRVYAVEDTPSPRFTCPKFMGLPDLARALVGEPPVFLDADLNVRVRPVADTFVEIGGRLGRGARASRAAYDRALEAQVAFEAALAAGCSFGIAAAEAAHGDVGATAGRTPNAAPTDLVVATVGHPYLLFDDFLSFCLQRRLAALGARTVTQYALSPEAIEVEMAPLGELSWSFERELLGAVGHFLRREDIDGIVFLTSFACGTFAVVSELIEREVRHGTDKPLLYLMVDELTGEAGVQTRLEAFCDTIRERS